MNYSSFRSRYMGLESLSHSQIESQVTFSVPKDAPPPRKIEFSNPKTADFLVDGKKIPKVEFDVGDSWAGLLPISGVLGETRKLFFWYFPPSKIGSTDDLIFWTNGGPGCSSMEGLLQGSGITYFHNNLPHPFSWSYGQAKPTVNEHSWTNLSHIIFVEQPVGAGYSQGIPNIKDEDDLARQLVGFLGRFLDVFSELKGKIFWLTGESYAGAYVPYIANYIYENPNAIDLQLQGIWIADPAITWEVVFTQIPAVDFVHKYDRVFSLNKTTMAQIDQTAKKCNYAEYMDNYVTFPPKGFLPLPGDSTSADPGCDVWTDIMNASQLVNPAFNPYRIFDTYPIFWDVLGFPGASYQIQDPPAYFDKTDVKLAVHVSPSTEWKICSEGVFPHGDASLPSALSVLPNVIEKSKRAVIIHGLADFAVLSDGTRIAIQNMTWNGLQGFRTPIEEESSIVDGVGALGTSHIERGLTYIEVELSGHMVAKFSPVAAFQSMQYLMGFRDEL